MSQPAAFFESIITHWRQVEIAKRLGQGVWQRDLFLGALSPESRCSLSAAGFIPCWVSAGMTPVLQLTDTDCSMSFKAAARREMSELRRIMKCRATQEGERATFKCGAAEILLITRGAHRSQVPGGGFVGGAQNTSPKHIPRNTKHHPQEAQTPSPGTTKTIPRNPPQTNPRNPKTIPRY